MPHMPFVTWYGNLLTVGTPRTMTTKPRGLVLHISDGTSVKDIPNLIGLASTFNSTDYPAHFGIDANGYMGQYIDTSRQDRATERGDDWFSVECCCFRGTALTQAQVSSAGFLFAILRQWYKSFELKAATSATDNGLAYHSLFLSDRDRGDPKKHWNCPGPMVIAQRDAIIRCATSIFGPT